MINPHRLRWENNNLAAIHVWIMPFISIDYTSYYALCQLHLKDIAIYNIFFYLQAIFHMVVGWYHRTPPLYSNFTTYIYYRRLIASEPIVLLLLWVFISLLKIKQAAKVAFESGVQLNYRIVINIILLERRGRSKLKVVLCCWWYLKIMLYQ